jgi:hypothetical protein
MQAYYLWLGAILDAYGAYGSGIFCQRIADLFASLEEVATPEEGKDDEEMGKLTP